MKRNIMNYCAEDAAVIILINNKAKLNDERSFGDERSQLHQIIFDATLHRTSEGQHLSVCYERN